ncbi:MAG: hypothetical protein EX260_01215 [Desulfobulbaceae bacterium]|nr:MAG: hypothetical protein EX260_01215 [Desulfobulbaceae bacterium]
MSLCIVCGNEIPVDDVVCPFCGAAQQSAADNFDETVTHRIVNIERGRPVVETALKKMENELLRARTDRVMVVTLIHGYGSSGKGGRIRTECRKLLDQMNSEKKINQLIVGEQFRKRTGPGKALLKRFPQLEDDCASDFSNPGVTIVVL